MVPWNPVKTKVQLRLAVQRLRVLQEKKTSLAKVSRREIASLLDKGKIETARIKVEGLINDDVYLELLELMELYCELLISRFGILELSAKEPDEAVSEAVCTLIHAATRTELKELHILREMLMHKYGREYALGVMENQGNCVPERIVSKLAVGTPPQSLVDAYLYEIAKGYHVDWTPPDFKADDDDDDDDDEGGMKETPAQDLEPALLSEPPAKKVAQDLADTAPPTLPSIPPAEGDATPKPKPAAEPKKKSAEDEFTELSKRFEALKKLR